MEREAKKILRRFQCDFNRSIEENFAQVLSENDRVRLFFINENRAFTDGQNIVVDPAIGEVFSDRKALERTEDYMGLGSQISSDPWHALRMITRGQNIHECLHILYTDFPSGIKGDSRATTRARTKTLAMISNIIEDAFIEAAGCSVFDNLEFYLKFERIAVMFANMRIEGTVERTFQTETVAAPAPLPLVEYLEYMAGFLLYPMIKAEKPPAEIAGYVDLSKKLFLDGSFCGDPKGRYEYTQKIFDIVEPLIPDSEEEINDTILIKMLPGTGTHSGDNQTINAVEKKGKIAEIARGLFTDKNGEMLPERNFERQLGETVDSFEKEKNAALQIVLVEPQVTIWGGTQFDCANIHKGIKIIETKPKPNLNLRRAYLNIYNKYHVNINSYNSRFVHLLKARVPEREEKRLFGSGIATRRLGDTKKRYWYRKAEEHGIPDIAVMLLIDGSGSMAGDRRESAMTSSLILHEVLKKQGITHSIVEHRAMYGQPTVNHNILIDFFAKDEEKYNILALAADDGTREGLSLFWAERYMATNTHNEEKLIIVLSDGEPAHGTGGDGCYYAPVSTKDTANAAAKIIRRGTNIIAVALDDGSEESYSCYDSLKEIYPSVIACTNLKQLTGQLLTTVSKYLL
ncbi:MAG: hypothetical protein FWH32_02415 [Clostridiales bacterium]|nr:hypothetical protein [Clostridiales bacterium]